MNSDTDPPRRDPSDLTLTCPACGRKIECKAEDLEFYERTSWPRCCRIVMKLADPESQNRDPQS